MNLDDLTLINMPVPCEQHGENIPESWSEIRVQCWRLLRVIIVKMCPLKYVIFYIQRNDHLAFSPFHLLPYFSSSEHYLGMNLFPCRVYEDAVHVKAYGTYLLSVDDDVHPAVRLVPAQLLFIRWKWNQGNSKPLSSSVVLTWNPCSSPLAFQHIHILAPLVI